MSSTSPPPPRTLRKLANLIPARAPILARSSLSSAMPRQLINAVVIAQNRLVQRTRPIAVVRARPTDRLNWVVSGYCVSTRKSRAAAATGVATLERLCPTKGAAKQAGAAGTLGRQPNSGRSKNSTRHESRKPRVEPMLSGVKSSGQTRLCAPAA